MPLHAIALNKREVLSTISERRASPNWVRMASSKAASLAKWSLGVSSVNQKSRMFIGFC